MADQTAESPELPCNQKNQISLELIARIQRSAHTFVMHSPVLFAFHTEQNRTDAADTVTELVLNLTAAPLSSHLAALTFTPVLLEGVLYH
jgi:hypothetical protein